MLSSTGIVIKDQKHHLTSVKKKVKSEVFSAKGRQNTKKVNFRINQRIIKKRRRYFKKKKILVRKRKFSIFSAPTRWRISWKVCKKPFWKRKSFTRFRQETNFFKNYYLYPNKISSFIRFRSNLTFRTKLFSFFKSNSIRKWFKTSIILRYYWRFRYARYSHRKLRNFLLTFKKKIHRLLIFSMKCELVLFRYILWWSILPSNTFITEQHSYNFVLHGFILVNFTYAYNPHYIVKNGDCVFFLVPSMNIKWKFVTWHSKLFISEFRNYGSIKHLVGHRSFLRFFSKKHLKHKKKKLKSFFVTYLRTLINTRYSTISTSSKKKIKKYNTFFTHSSTNKFFFLNKIRKKHLNVITGYLFSGLHFYYETSYKFRIILNLTGIQSIVSQLSVKRTQVADYRVSFYLANRALNFTYW